MSNEEKILELLLAMRSDISDLKTGQEALEKRQETLEKQIASLEHELVPKVTVLFDAFELRGDQIERLQNHVDERLDDFREDITFLFSKAVKQEKELFSVSKLVRQITP